MERERPVSSFCVAARKDEANRVLRTLLRAGAVRKELRIRYDGENVFIPVHQEMIHEGISLQTSLFEERALPEAPSQEVSTLLRRAGSTKGFPEKFILMGSALVIKDSRASDYTQSELEIIAGKFGAESIYVDRGIQSGPVRHPVMDLVFGRGGETVHLENGIKYWFDPLKVMFSPGNVNSRISESRQDFSGQVVLDMFAGIGYFSLQAARNSPGASIFSCEINPVSFNYLTRNIKANRMGGQITPIAGDCRKVSEGITADYILMGHFQSQEFLSTALLRSRKGTVINMHLLVPTDELQSKRYSVQEQARKLGYVIDHIHQNTVKSYGPHLWHISIQFMISRIMA